MTPARRLPSKGNLFIILMALSALMAVIPAGATRWISRVFQPLSALQGPLADVSQATRGALADSPAGKLSERDVARILEENQQLRRQISQQNELLIARQQQLQAISGIAQEFPDEQARIWLAPVVAFDADPRRETIKILRGSLHRVQAGQWVAAATRESRWPSDSSGRELLLRQWLIGRVIEVLGPHVSRVQLTTDPQFRQQVTLAVIAADGTWQTSSDPAVLYGRGGGEMRIRSATEDATKSGRTIVVVQPSNDLPAPMTLGRVVGARPLDQSPLHFDLDVEPWGVVRSLSHVFIIVPAAGAD